ncbi:hypothetical protein [Flavisphingomonas formosensis]|uniref:hypothetical protein n=1 Tax=Flavisphingomonas formosensis TaxID=861534 RepID=UPI0012FC21EA|nr:hypothetical protein [Sphingomonas formosensis]
MRWPAALLACVFAALASPLAAKAPPEIRQIPAGELTVPAQDKGYVLARLDTSLYKLTIDILRIPSREELGTYEVAKRAAFEKAGRKAGPYESFVFDYEGRPNFFALRPSPAAATSGKLAVILAELPPGDYVLYGQGYQNWLFTCFCYGTVGFSVRPGAVTDLGTVFFGKASEPSPIPELAGEVGLGRTASMDYNLFAVGLRPARAGDVLPAGLDLAHVVPAKLHAIGPFVETNTVLVSRLAAIPGVLSYDGGRVIDVVSGKEALPQ